MVRTMGQVTKPVANSGAGSAIGYRSIFSIKYIEFIALVFSVLIVFGLFPALAGEEAASFYSSESSSLSSNESPVGDEGGAAKYSKWELRIAQEVIATGQILEGNPHFDDVVTRLKDRSLSLMPEPFSLTQQWVREQLHEILPEFDNEASSAALEAAAAEISRGTGKTADNLFGQAITLYDGSPSQSEDLVTNAKETMWRSGLEGLKAAASVSDLVALNNLELEYSLLEGGLDEYSLLTVQPLYESANLHNNVFVQASYANAMVEDNGAGTSDRRDTLNVGLAYRYITEDKQHMFGANAFVDHQWPYHHNRMSLGVDYKNSLIGAHLNHYIGLSDWRVRDDGFEEKALSGTDLTFSGRLPQAPELEMFTRGFHWDQERTAVRNPNGDDIWGYELAAEYTPINFLTFRGEVLKDNEMDDFDGTVTVRMNYNFGQGWDDLWERPSYNLNNVIDRRFDKVRRINEIRVQVRQDSDVTARVTFAQGANVSVGQSLAFDTFIATGAAAGDGATVLFGNGARLDVGQSTQVQIERDQIVLIEGIIQFTSGSGGITVIAVPGGKIELIGTDVDVRVAGVTSTLRVRDGAADFTDDTSTTRVGTEELAEAQDGDGLAPQIRAEGTVIYETHTSAAHIQLDLVGPAPLSAKAAPFADEAVSVTGTLATGNTLSFIVPLTSNVTVTGAPQLRFTLGGMDRLADYASGSGTSTLVFTYDVVGADETLSNIVAKEIEKNGGTLIGTNGAPMLRTVSGGVSGTVLDVTAPSIAGFTTVSSGGDPAGINDVITVTLNADEELVQSGLPTLTLNIGGTSRTANFSAINMGNAEFTYTVQAGDNDADGITITAITTVADELEDASGNDLDTTFALPYNLNLDVSTSPPVSAPSFSFTSLNNQASMIQVTSNIAQVSGLTSAENVAVSGGTSTAYRICSDAICSTVLQDWTSSGGTISNNQYVQLRTTTNAPQGATIDVNATISGTTETWSITIGLIPHPVQPAQPI